MGRQITSVLGREEGGVAVVAVYYHEGGREGWGEAGRSRSEGV